MYLDLLRIVSLNAYLSADLWPALYSTNTSITIKLTILHYTSVKNCYSTKIIGLSSRPSTEYLNTVNYWYSSNS